LECDRVGLQEIIKPHMSSCDFCPIDFVFVSVPETTWKFLWWASYPKMGWYSLLSIFIRKDTLSCETSCNFLKTEPFP